MISEYSNTAAMPLDELYESAQEAMLWCSETPERVQAVLRLRLEGHTWRDIAKSLGQHKYRDLCPDSVRAKLVRRTRAKHRGKRRGDGYEHELIQHESDGRRRDRRVMP